MKMLNGGLECKSANLGDGDSLKCLVRITQGSRKASQQNLRGLSRRAKKW